MSISEFVIYMNVRGINIPFIGFEGRKPLYMRIDYEKILVHYCTEPFKLLNPRDEENEYLYIIPTAAIVNYDIKTFNIKSTKDEDGNGWNIARAYHFTDVDWFERNYMKRVFIKFDRFLKEYKDRIDEIQSKLDDTVYEKDRLTDLINGKY